MKFKEILSAANNGNITVINTVGFMYLVYINSITNK